VPPRYDVPNSAPEPLRRVQLFVNSTDVHNRVEWLPEWLEAHDLVGADDRARELREAIRALVLANNGLPLDPGALETLNGALARVRPVLDAERRLRFSASGDALDEIVVVVLGAILDGSFERLKACRNCAWSFYDYSRNRSATWCSMRICGNRTKTRAYRRRRRAASP